MKKLAAAAAALFAIGACTETPTEESFDPGAAEQFIGKKLTTEDGRSTFLFFANGTVGGNTRTGAAIEGTYSARGDLICSSYTAPSNLIDLGEICSKPAIEGNTVVFNRTNGSQSPRYVITD